MGKTLEVDLSGYHSNGYVIIPAVFNIEEIEEFRRIAYKTQTIKGDLLSIPELSHIVLDDRIIEIVTKILGDKPVYFGDSSCVIGCRGRGFHKDNADRHDSNAPDWQSTYTVIRLGIYLQDHFDHSGGLNVLQGSHNTVNHEAGQNFYLRMRIGDIVVWNMRTTHSANGIILKDSPNIAVHPVNVNSISKERIAPPERERVAFFLAYGRKDHHLDRYIDYLKARQYMIVSWRNSRYNSNVWNSVKEKPLILRDVSKEIESKTNLGRNIGYLPIPY